MVNLKVNVKTYIKVNVKTYIKGRTAFWGCTVKYNQNEMQQWKTWYFGPSLILDDINGIPSYIIILKSIE